MDVANKFGEFESGIRVENGQCYLCECKAVLWNTTIQLVTMVLLLRGRGYE